jgi:hypothetical protein
MSNFKDIFWQQKQYNRKIRLLDPRSNGEWTETYLLGLVSEINEILDGMQWKRHRKISGKKPDVVNLGYEFADLTKYVMSLWELWGFTAEEMLEFVEQKSDILDELYRQEFDPIPSDRLIIITDLDGTLGDWRKTFISWAYSAHGIEPVIDGSTSLQLDSDLAMRYADYFKLKEEFESSGQYQHIIIYSDTLEFLTWLKAEFNAYIIIHTARPWQRYHRIWGDTWEWIKTNRLPVDQLRIGADSRILLAGNIGGENVLMLEDDPGLMLRAACSGISVVARKHLYNNGVDHAKITFVGSLSDAKESIENEYRILRTRRETVSS